MAVVQLVERQIVVLDVAGSSPVGYPKIFLFFMLTYNIYSLYTETVVVFIIGAS